MKVLVTLETKFGFNCVSCRERVRACEKYLQVQHDDGRNVRGEKYCLRCEKYAKLNNPELVEFDDDDEAFRSMQRSERQREDYAAYQAAGCVSEYWTDRDNGYAH